MKNSPDTNGGSEMMAIVKVADNHQVSDCGHFSCAAGGHGALVCGQTSAAVSASHFLYQGYLCNVKLYLHNVKSRMGMLK